MYSVILIYYDNISNQTRKFQTQKYFKQSANVSGRLSFTKEDNDYLNILKNLRLVDDNNNFKRAGLLLFGKDPLKYFTTAFIKIGKFGDSGSELLSQDVIEGNVFEQADVVLEILDKNTFKSRFLIKDCKELKLLNIHIQQYVKFF